MVSWICTCNTVGLEQTVTRIPPPLFLHIAQCTDIRLLLLTPCGMPQGFHSVNHLVFSSTLSLQMREPFHQWLWSAYFSLQQQCPPGQQHKGSKMGH
jgi:hypothetical protein